MTDATRDLSEAGVSETGLDWEDEVPEAVLTRVKDLFTTLTKAIRAHQLYDENNPVYQRFVSGLAEAFSDLWTEVDALPVQVQESRILWRGEEVYRNDNRSESLSFLFFKDGVRELTFEPGIEGDELTRLLGVLQTARNLRPESDDLLTILWDEDLQHLDYSYVDVLAEGVELPVPGEGNEADEMQAVIQGELDEPETLAPEDEEDEEGEAGTAAPEPPPGQVSTEDLNPTLYSLDAKELDQLRGELQDEMDRDLRRSVLEALFDRLEEPDNRERQSEILGILRTLLPNFLSRGALRPAAAVLHELDAVRGADGMLDEKRQEDADEVLEAVSSPETVGELIRALRDGAIDAEARRLGTFLQFLRPTALKPLLEAVEETEDRKLQETLREALTAIAGKHTGVVLDLMYDSSPVVAAGAARLAGRMELRDAGPKLADMLKRDDPDVRLGGGGGAGAV